MTALCLTLPLLVRPAQAEDAVVPVCLVAEAPGEGLDAEAVVTALLVEGRKRGAVIRVSAAGVSSACPDGCGVLRVGPGSAASVTWSGSAPAPVDLDQVPAADRANAVARAVIERAGVGATEVRVARLVDDDVELGILGPPSPGPAPVFVAMAGGRFTHDVGPGIDGGGAEVELGVALWSEQLAFGAIGAWNAAAEVAGAPTHLAREGGELLGVVRGGYAFGVVVVRVGVAAGWQWRRIESAHALRFVLPAIDDGAGVLALEPELLWKVSGPWRVSLGVPLRLYLGGDDQLWLGEVVYPAPDGSVGVVLRAGVAL
jgi:hypothetical protein